MSTSRILSTAALAAALLGVVACGGDGPAKVEAAVVKRTTTTTMPPTTAPAAPAPAPTAPLTGIVPTGDEVGAIGRPALAIKIDNSPPAVPQDGLNRTDVVLEVMVEGISRLMAVYHSHDAASVGPTRSARHSDPDLLAMFGRPLFGWSGANEEVIGDVLSRDWIVNVEWERVQRAYARRGGRPAPHNLYTSTPALFQRAEPGQAVPQALFDRLVPGEPLPGSPLPGVSLRIGSTDSTWVWDAAAGRYARWEYGRAHHTDDGQVWATNVVVLQTAYARGPTARSTGQGRAWVMVGGNIVEGIWTRNDRTHRYTITGLDGAPIHLAPGRTWMELPPDPPTALDAQRASVLLAGPR